MMISATASLMCVALSASAALAQAPDADQLLREMAAYHAEVDVATFDYTARIEMSGDGMKVAYWSTYDAALRKPDHLHIDLTEGWQTLSLAASDDGLFVYVPESNTYVEQAPVNDLSEALQLEAEMLGFIGYLFAGPGLRTLLDGDPVTLYEEVEGATYVREKEVDGTAAHHITARDHDFWIAADGPPRLLQARRSLPAEWTQGMGVADVAGHITMSISNWQTPETIAADRFAFDPPAGASQAESILEAYFGETFGAAAEEMEEPEEADLVGEQAPRFELAMLAGETLALDQTLREHEVVILDFWATWCPPCRRGLPLLDELAKEQAERGVVVYAINLREDDQTAADYMEREGLSLPIAFDRDGAVAGEYGVTGIPQTVVIDGDGRVRAVHVGFNPNMKEELEREIEASLAGEEIATTGSRSGAAELPDAENLEQAWALAGDWGSVAATDDGTIIAARGQAPRRTALALLTAEGEEEQALTVDQRGGIVRPAQLDGDAAPEFAVYGHWGTAAAFDDDGEKLWSLPRSTGVNELHPVDLDGDGVDEVVIGYNGGTGVLAYDAKGERLWRNNSVGNVWHVTAADVTGDQTPEVVTTSAGGNVHIFRADTGESVNTFRSADYVSLVRPATLDGEVLLLAGTSGMSENGSVICFDGSGRERWRFTLSGTGDAEAMQAARTRPWGAVAFRGGALCIFDLETGEILARGEAGARAELAWREANDEPILLVTDGRRLTALRISPGATSDGT